MLGKLFKKDKPKLYLGSVVVAPRKDIGRHFDQWGALTGYDDIDSSLSKSLKDFFNLPIVSDVSKVSPNDLALDIVIPNFQSGDCVEVMLGDFRFPIVWRPKIEIACRLYRVSNGKTQYVSTETVKMPWKSYFSRLVSWRGIFRHKPLFDSSDMELLMYRACGKILGKLSKHA